MKEFEVLNSYFGSKLFSALSCEHAAEVAMQHINNIHQLNPYQDVGFLVRRSGKKKWSKYLVSSSIQYTTTKIKELELSK